MRKGTFADRVAERILPDVESRDRGLALELAFGCLRLRARMDTWIAAFTDRPLARMDPEVLDWLRIGVYQIRELRIPDHAAVGETVRQARRRMDRGRVGYINAVLRAVAGDAERDPFPSRDTDPVGYLTTWGSHPEWLVRRWLERWTLHDVFRLVKIGNAPPPVVVRSLAEGGEATVRDLPGLRRLAEWPGSWEMVEGTPAEALGHIEGVVQDPAASAVVEYLGGEVRGPVYDACAAPGTKTMGIAARASGPLLAGDRSRRRLERIRGSARRLGIPVTAAVIDARAPAVRPVPTVVLDVPCTGTGVLRRRADARWRIAPEDIASLAEVQREILDAGADRVEAGGLLLYATCSLESEENEMQIDEFLKRRPDFEREPVRDGPIPRNCLTSAGDLFVRPWLTGTDGAFAARLRRAS